MHLISCLKIQFLCCLGWLFRQEDMPSYTQSDQCAEKPIRTRNRLREKLSTSNPPAIREKNSRITPEKGGEKICPGNIPRRAVTSHRTRKIIMGSNPHTGLNLLSVTFLREDNNILLNIVGLSPLPWPFKGGNSVSPGVRRNNRLFGD